MGRDTSEHTIGEPYELHSVWVLSKLDTGCTKEINAGAAYRDGNLKAANE